MASLNETQEYEKRVNYIKIFNRKLGGSDRNKLQSWRMVLDCPNGCYPQSHD